MRVNNKTILDLAKASTEQFLEQQWSWSAHLAEQCDGIHRPEAANIITEMPEDTGSTGGTLHPDSAQFQQYCWKTGASPMLACARTGQTMTIDAISSSSDFEISEDYRKIPTDETEGLLGSHAVRKLEAKHVSHIQTPAALVFSAHPTHAVLDPTRFSIPGTSSAQGLGIGGINGINTSLEKCIYYASELQELAPEEEIQWVYNRSHGFFADLVRSFLYMLGYAPETSSLLRQQWDEFDQKNADKPDAKFLQFCHSQGAIHVKNALASAPPHIRDRIIVVAIAPATIVPKHLCFQSFNYSSELDIVPKCKMWLYMLGEAVADELSEPLNIILEEQKELIVLNQHPHDSGMGHGFLAKTFEEIIQDHMKEHLRCGGAYTRSV